MGLIERIKADSEKDAAEKARIKKTFAKQYDKFGKGVVAGLDWMHDREAQAGQAVETDVQKKIKKKVESKPATITADGEGKRLRSIPTLRADPTSPITGTHEPVDYEKYPNIGAAQSNLNLRAKGVGPLTGAVPESTPLQAKVKATQGGESYDWMGKSKVWAGPHVEEVGGIANPNYKEDALRPGRRKTETGYFTDEPPPHMLITPYDSPEVRLAKQEGLKEWYKGTSEFHTEQPIGRQASLKEKAVANIKAMADRDVAGITARAHMYRTDSPMYQATDTDTATDRGFAKKGFSAHTDPNTSKLMVLDKDTGKWTTGGLGGALGAGLKAQLDAAGGDEKKLKAIYKNNPGSMAEMDRYLQENNWFR